MSVASPDREDAAALRARLGAVRRTLLEDATGEAEQIVAEAAAQAQALVDETREEISEKLDRAERRAEMSAQANAEQSLARSRAAAQRQVLQAKEAIRIRLVDEVHAAALRLRDDPDYPRLLDALGTLARIQLGPGAIIDRDPRSVGGVLGEADGRKVDYSLLSVSDRALETLADEVARLWA